MLAAITFAWRGPRGLSICPAKDKSCLPGIRGTTRYAQLKSTGGALSYEDAPCFNDAPPRSPLERYNLAKGLDTVVLRDQKARTAMADKSVEGWWIRYSQVAELPYVDVVDASDRSVAPHFAEDKSGDRVFEPAGRIIEDDDIELVGEYYYVGKKKLRQEYSKSIGRKVEEIDEVAFGLEFNSLFPDLDENGNIVMINEGRRSQDYVARW